MATDDKAAVIKLDKHLLTCRCDDCAAMFPSDQYDVIWSTPKPTLPAMKAIGRLPLGAPGASWPFTVWLTPDLRLVGDWPGFPGTDGARVEVAPPSLHDPDAPAEIVGTHDPALAALAHPVPLRRRAVGRFNARCMVDYGLADDDVADYIPCDVHGHGLPALACRCVTDAAAPLDVAVLYDVDGDYPDAFCLACLERYTARDLSVCVTVCSRCQRAHLLRHRVVQSGCYGGAPSP